VSVDSDGSGVLFDVGYCLMDESARLRRALDWVAETLSAGTAGGRPASSATLAALYGSACRHPRPGESSLIVQILLEAGVPAAEAQAIRRRLPWDALPLDVYPDAVQSLRALRDSGFRVGVLANQPASARTDLDRAGVSPLCDGLWLSGAVGLAKPDPRFFRLALDTWGLPPRRVAYVGDRPDTDVAPAKALEMATVRLRVGPHAGQPARGEGETATMEAKSLTEAVVLLRRWREELACP
jgi:HAD superfamily hydrolase (TIGR01509 family)